MIYSFRMVGRCWFQYVEDSLASESSIGAQSMHARPLSAFTIHPSRG